MADLPSQECPVRIELATRRFLGAEPDCPPKIFAERVKELAAADGRTTQRLREVLDLKGRALLTRSFAFGFVPYKRIWKSPRSLSLVSKS